MDWDKLRIFHAAAEAGSFTHAGEQLHMSQSAVSRQISALEDASSGFSQPSPVTVPGDPFSNSAAPQQDRKSKTTVRRNQTKVLEFGL